MLARGSIKRVSTPTQRVDTFAMPSLHATTTKVGMQRQSTRKLHSSRPLAFKNQFDAFKNAFKMAENLSKEFSKHQKDGNQGFPFDPKELQEMMKNMPIPPNMVQKAGPSGDWFPAVDVVESATDYVHYFDVPGLKKGDIKLKVKGDKLIVSGQRPSIPKDHFEVTKSERWSGSFAKEVDLDTAKVDLAAIRAVCQDGVLTVTIPKTTPDNVFTVMLFNS